MHDDDLWPRKSLIVRHFVPFKERIPSFTYHVFCDAPAGPQPVGLLGICHINFGDDQMSSRPTTMID